MAYDLYSLNQTGNYKRVIPENINDLSLSEHLRSSNVNSKARASNIHHMRFTIYTWPMLLNLARSYGWQPMGTEAPLESSDNPEEEYLTPKGWDGNYETNDRQVVKDEDAINLAEALEKALDDIPDNSDTIQKFLKLKPGDKMPEGSLKAQIIGQKLLDSGKAIEFYNYTLHPFEYFSGNEKKICDRLYYFLSEWCLCHRLILMDGICIPTSRDAVHHLLVYGQDPRSGLFS